MVPLPSAGPADLLAAGAAPYPLLLSVEDAQHRYGVDKTVDGRWHPNFGTA